MAMMPTLALVSEPTFAANAKQRYLKQQLENLHLLKGGENCQKPMITVKKFSQAEITVMNDVSIEMSYNTRTVRHRCILRLKSNRLSNF